MTTAAVDDLFRVYLDPDEIGADGYPFAWHGGISGIGTERDPIRTYRPIKDLVRGRDGHRCLRCGHPYEKGMGEWSPCDERCTHRGPMRFRALDEEGAAWIFDNLDRYGHSAAEARTDIDSSLREVVRFEVEAQWRILTVHHLNGVKHDCRWWNLVSLCQRCHLTIQGKVYMERPYQREHTEWFKPFAAAYYASSILGEELSRKQVDARLEDLLALQFTEPALF